MAERNSHPNRFKRKLARNLSAWPAASWFSSRQCKSANHQTPSVLTTSATLYASLLVCVFLLQLIHQPVLGAKLSQLKSKPFKVRHAQSLRTHAVVKDPGRSLSSDAIAEEIDGTSLPPRGFSGEFFSGILRPTPSESAERTFAFTQDVYAGTIPENSRGKVYVLTDGKMGVFAQHPESVKFKIVKGDAKNFFKAESRVVGNFAFLRLRTRSGLDVNLNREHTDTYELLIKATYKHDRGRNIETRTSVLVKILDVNEMTPVFFTPEYEATIREDAPIFSNVVRVEASDADLGVNGEICYSLLERSDLFAIHPSTGVISLIKRPTQSSAGNRSRYELTVLAEDRASILFQHLQQSHPNEQHQQQTSAVADRRSSRAKVTIHLQKSNLYAPEIAVVDFDRYHVNNLTAASNKSFLLAMLRVSDADEGLNGEIARVEIVSGDAEKLFRVVKSKHADGQATLYHIEIPSYLLKRRHVDLPTTHELSVQATDAGLPPRQTTKIVDINLVKSTPNDSAVRFAQSTYHFQVNETAPILTPVGFALLETLPNSKEFTWEWQLLLPNGTSLNAFPFAINSKTGLIYVSGTLDFEETTIYSFKVKAVLNAALKSPDTSFAEASITVNVLDENDNTPVIREPHSPLIHVQRSIPLESVVVTIVASDADAGDNGLITYSVAQTDSDADGFSPFLVDAYTGEVKVARRPSLRAYALHVRASDLGSPIRREVEVRLLINVTNAASSQSARPAGPGEGKWQFTAPNEHAPAFSGRIPAEILIAENSSVDNLLYRLHANDDDFGANAWLRYVICNGGANESDARWKVDTYTGDLMLLRPLNRNEAKRYDVTIAVHDMGQPQRSAQRDVRILVADSNLNAPVFEKPSYVVRLSEDANVGEQINLRIRATDADEGLHAKIAYSFVSGEDIGFHAAAVGGAAPFAIDSGLGTLSVAKGLDREKFATHELWIRAQDSGEPPLQSLAKLTVELSDVNDNAPKCLQRHQKLQLPEDLPVGSLVTCLAAADPDSGLNGQFTFAFDQQSSSGQHLPFGIGQENGCIWMTGLREPDRGLDFETRQIYNLSVEITDRGIPQLSSLCYVEVEIMDVNENRFAPEFSDFVFSASVFENENIGTEVLRVHAIDPDASYTAANESVSYFLSGEDGLGIFNIDQNGVIRTAVRLDREAKSFYWLSVVAKDQAAVPLFATADVYVDVANRNDNCPQTSSAIYFAAVLENSPPGTFVVKIDAFDADDDASARSALHFRITRGDPQSFFRVDPLTGYVTTHGRRLDREKQLQHELEITISDSGEPSLSSTVVVVVDVQDENDSPPVFLQTLDDGFEIPETNGVSEERMFRILATDADAEANAKLKFEIIGGNAEKLFRLNQTSGEVFAIGAIAAHESFQLTIKVTDVGFPSFFAETNLSVRSVAGPENNDTQTNKPPYVLSSEPVKCHISDSDVEGALIGQIEAEDPETETIWFDIKDSHKRVNELFDVNKSTGQIRLVGRIAPDDESRFSFSVVVSDRVNSVITQVEVTVSRTKATRPVFEESTYAVAVAEDAVVGSILARPRIVMANEEVSSFSVVSYSLFGAASIESLKKFRVEPLTGNIVLLDSLDHEVCRQHVVTVLALHRNQLRNFATVILNVVDANDHAPKFSAQLYEAKVFESVSVGSMVLLLTAYDLDFGENAKLVYSIISGNADHFFDVDSSLGVIRVAKQLDVRSPEHVLTVKVEDSGPIRYYDTASVHVLVTLSPISAPKFKKDLYHLDVPESTVVGTALVTIQADATCSVFYRLKKTTENNECYFRLCPSNGILFLDQPLSYDSKRVLNVAIIASSSTGLESETKLRIAVTDSNTHPPVFAKLIYHGVVQENMPSGTVVKALDVAGNLTTNIKSSAKGELPLFVSATDADTGTNALISYRIVDPWAAEFFTIDYGTGTVRTKISLDYDGEAARKEFAFEVSAIDLGTPSLRAVVNALCIVRLLNQNDLSPIFDRSEFSANLHLPTVAGVRLLQVHATDGDEDALLKYEFDRLQSDDSVLAQFELDAKSGQLVVGRNADLIGWKEVYEIRVSVTDGLHVDSAVVVIKVSSERSTQHGLQFSLPMYEVAVLENYTIAQTVLRVQAIGSRIGEQVTYSLLNENPWFALHPISGSLSTTGVPLDREEAPVRFLIAEARSPKAPVKSAQVLIKITVQDINDCTPLFVNEPYFARIPFDALSDASSRAAANVTSVRAIDHDAGQNGNVTYSLKQQSSTSLARWIGSYFQLDAITGQLSMIENLPKSFQGKEFDLTVVASDNGTPKLTAESTVKLKIVNRAMPLFGQQLYAVTVSENASVGLPFLTVEAVSAVGGVLVYYIAEGNDDSVFRIDAGSGVLSLTHTLDHESTPFHKLMVRCLDLNSLIFSDVPVEIRVLDVNDNAPRLNRTLQFSVPENAALFSQLFTLAATDADSGDNAKLSYYLSEIPNDSLSIDSARVFSLDSDSGTVTLMLPVDFETRRIYRFLVTVRDAGLPVLETVSVVTVQISDVNDNIPVFSQSLYEIEAMSGSKSGHFLALLSASDVDEVSRGNLIYSIFDGNDEHLFEINKKSGVFSIAKESSSFDAKLFILNVSVSDGVFTAHCKANVRLQPSVLRAPMFEQRVMSVSIMENIAVNSVVSTVKAEGSSPLEFSFVGKYSDAVPFRINKETGQVFVRLALDMEMKAQYNLPLSVRDQRGQVGFGELRISVTNVNDNSPAFVCKQHTAVVSANASQASTILTLIATDADNDRVEYSLYKDSATDDIRKYFKLDRYTGELIVKSDLQAVAGNTFQFFAQALDQGNPPKSDEVSVEVFVAKADELLPRFEQPEYFFSVNEAESVDSKIGRVVAHYAGQGNLRYSVEKSAVASNDASAMLRIDDSGNLFVIEEFDREQQSSFVFYVAATIVPPTNANIKNRDTAKEFKRALTLCRLTVEDANDNAPQFQASYADLHISEDAPVGSSLGIISATDADLGSAGHVQFSIALSGVDMLPFKIDIDSGWMTLVAPLDREKKDRYNFTVIARDAGQTPLSAIIAISAYVDDVNDEPPVFASANYRFEVPETMNVGEVVGFVSASDSDLAPNNITALYLFDDEGRDQFSLNENGHVLVAHALDYERRKSFVLHVLASDGLHSSTAAVEIALIDIADNAPVCEQEFVRLNVPEDTPVRTEYMAIIADDVDTVDRPLRFVMLDEKLQQVGVEDWTLIAEKGVLVIAEKLDRERQDLYRFTLRAIDSVGSFCETVVTIVISDANDPPIFTQSLYETQIMENLQSPLTLITVVSATDSDSGLNGKLTYKLLDNFDGIFNIEENTGAVITKRSFDRELRETYNLSVIAIDGGSLSLSSSAFVVVTILDANDNPPEFTRTVYFAQIEENAPPGPIIANPLATSKDVGQNAKVIYSIVQPTDQTAFSINEDSGAITAAQSLDYESQSFYILTIQAKDQGDPPLFATSRVNVTIMDVNDNSPRFTQSIYQKTVFEDISVGSKIVKLIAHDLDSGSFGAIKYRIVTAAFQEYFSIDDDGWLTSTALLDREKKANYTLLIEASDQGSPPLTDQTTVVINLEDVNDNAPIIQNCENISVTIQEGLDPGYTAFQFRVTDADLPANGAPFKFRLSGSGSENFKITDEGSLQTRNSLSFADQKLHKLKALISDSGNPAMTSECAIVIRVIEESKFAPVILPIKHIRINSYLDEFPGSVIARVEATDRDPLDRVTYGMVQTEQVKDQFNMDPLTGNLLALASLDIGHYELNVTATDGKFVSYATIPVSVQLISEELLDSSVSIQLANVDTVDFVARFEDKFVKAVAKVLSARPKNVILVSIQSTLDRRRRSDELSANIKMQEKSAQAKQDSGIDVLFAVEKGRNGYYKPSFVQRRLESATNDVSREIGLAIVHIQTELCERNSCVKGDCQDKLLLDDVHVESILTGSISFIAPRHQRSFDCVCQEGFGGSFCNVPINECSRGPCAAEKICIPVDSVTGYQCVCPAGKTGPTCSADICADGKCNKSSAMSFNGKSYVRYSLSTPVDRRLQLGIELRTTAPAGVVFHAGGKVDYNVLEIAGGFVRYRFDCGSGEGLVQILDVPVTDGHWHFVKVTRLGRNVRLTLDDKFTVEGVSPGSNQVLNLDDDDVFFGAEVRRHPTLYGHDDIRNGFIGCLNRIFIDNFELPKSKPGLVRLYNVNFHCRDVFIAGACSSQPCKNFGSCVTSAQGTAFSCLCHPRFTGRLCEMDLNACASNPCFHGATCENMYNDFFCRCPPGLTGKVCREHGDFDECISSPCRNGGKCANIPGSFECNCTQGWMGRLCSEEEKPTNLEGGEWWLGVNFLELLIGTSVVLACLIITICFACFCRRRNQRKFLKKRYHLANTNNAQNNELVDCNYMQPMRNELVFNNAKAGAAFGVASVVPAENCPPRLPPRQFQRGKKLSNFESAVSTGIPTVQVRPLSYGEMCGNDDQEDEPNQRAHDAQNNNRQPHDTGDLTDCAQNYGSAADDLEQMTRNFGTHDMMQTFGKPSAGVGGLQTAIVNATGLPGAKHRGNDVTFTSFSGSSDIESFMDPKSQKFQKALNLFNGDSLEQLKAIAKGDLPKRRTNGVSVEDSSPGSLAGVQSIGSIQCLAEEDSVTGYYWDNSDWKSTLGGHSAYAGDTLAHSEADSGPLPIGVSQLEDGDELDYPAGDELHLGREDVDVPDLPTSDFQQQLRALERLTRAGRNKHKGTVQPCGETHPLSSQGPEDVEMLEIEPMKPLASYQRHLDRYLPKHLVPPDSSRSERRHLLSPDTDNLDHSSDGESDDGNDDEGEYELGSGHHFMIAASSASDFRSATAPAALRHRSSEKKKRVMQKRLQREAAEKIFGMAEPTPALVHAVKPGCAVSSPTKRSAPSSDRSARTNYNANDGLMAGAGRCGENLWSPSLTSSSSFRPSVSQNEYDSVAESQTSISELAGICELEDFEDAVENIDGVTASGNGTAVTANSATAQNNSGTLVNNNNNNNNGKQTEV